MIQTLKKVKAKGYRIGIITGSSHSKILRNVTEEHLPMFDFVFGENGMHNLDTRTGELKVKKIVDYLGKEDHDKLVKWTSEYL